MAVDRFFLNALVRKSRRLPVPQPGTWASDAPKGDFLAHFAADILVEGQVQDAHTVSSVPSVYARPIQFVQALSQKEHPLHDTLGRQWRGLLGVFALADYLDLSIGLVPYEVPKRPNPEQADCNLATVLRNQLPRPAADWDTFWLIYCDGALLGATSPWTVVYTAAQYGCPASIPFRDGQGLLTDPLEHYRKVPGVHVELTLYAHYLDRLLEEPWGFERRLDDRAAAIKREILALRKELEPFREGHVQAAQDLGPPRIDVWPYRAFLRSVSYKNASGPQSTLLLAAPQGEPTLLIPRTGMQPQRRVYQSLLYQDLDIARMPAEGKAGWMSRTGRSVPMPYIIPEEVFLPKRLAEITLSDRAWNPGRGPAEFALPLTPALLRFFRFEDLIGRPDLLMITVDRQDIYVKLRLPLYGEAPLSVERRYRRGVDTFKMSTPVLALWPDFHSADFTGNMSLYHGDTPEVSVRPLCADGTALESSGEGAGQRTWAHKAPTVGFALFQKDMPVGMVLREGLPAPDKVREDREWTVSVDFGTSNTHILVDEGHGPPQPLALKGRTVCLTQAREEFKEALRTFYPTEAPRLPLVTLVVENPAQALGERGDGRYTPVFTFYPDLLVSQGAVKNVKWGGQAGGTDAEAPLRAYLLGILRYISAEARARGVGSLQFRWSFPMSLPEGARGAMAAFWGAVDAFTPSIHVQPASALPEAEAACRYLSQSRLDILPVGSDALSIVVDVGGGSSDIGFWTQGKLLDQLSFYLAGNHLTEEFVRLPGLAHTLFRICSGQIDSTYEAVRPAFESRPTIMFNAIVSQAKGLQSDNPQEHPVVRELFGGTLAPHGGAPWVHARGLAYLLFSGLAFYSGVHARRLLLDEGKGARGDEERRFFLYFGGRGSSLLSWLSRSGEVLQQVLSAAFREGLFAENLLRGRVDPARCRVEVMGPAIAYKPKAPPKEEVVGGLLVHGPEGADSGAAAQAGARREALVGERGFAGAQGEARWDEALDLGRLRALKVQRGFAGERYIDRFLSWALREVAPGGPLQELNLSIVGADRELKVDPDKVQHRLHQSGIVQPVFIHELKVLLQTYADSAGKARGR